MRSSGWSSDVCSSGLAVRPDRPGLRADLQGVGRIQLRPGRHGAGGGAVDGALFRMDPGLAGVREPAAGQCAGVHRQRRADVLAGRGGRSEEHTSELQSLMRISYAVFCLTKKTTYPVIVILCSNNI